MTTQTRVNDVDNSAEIAKRVQGAIASGQALDITGAGTKSFLGHATPGEPLPVAGHRGIIHYSPAELVLTARAGTPLSEIESALADADQMLPFEPPHFGAGATLGGTLACALSGPRRAYCGAARDFVLGTTIINGHGHTLRLGGEVIKNVAGYDLSRFMVGAMGTLGVLVDASLKVLPRSREELTLVQEVEPTAALQKLSEWGVRPLPLSASCVTDKHLYIRLSGSPSAVHKARETLGGELLQDHARFWRRVREHEHSFFAGEAPLWRLSVAGASNFDESLGPQLIEWGGALRWSRSQAPARTLRAAAEAAGGHATLFRCEGAQSERFHPLPPALRDIQRQLRLAFDPQSIFNRGRLYADV